MYADGVVMNSETAAVLPENPVRERRSLDLVWWGVATFAAVLVVALLVGWILVWALRGGGAREVMISLGSVAFTLVLVAIGLLLARLAAERRLREVEARFVTGASHNLRTPLAGVLAASQALGRDPTISPADRERLLAAIRRESRLLALRLDNLIESGRVDLERDRGGREPADLAAIVREAIGSVEDRALERGGHIRASRISEDLPIEADSRMIRLVVENLLDNAIRFSPAAPEVEVELEGRDGKAVLSIRDRGVGFDPADPPRFGRRFSRDPSKGGLGLGLHLSSWIARDHGGTLVLTSDGPGQGAFAELVLPTAYMPEE